MDAEWINIPKVCTKDDLPVDSSEIATLEKVKKWKYLQKNAEEISHRDDVRWKYWCKAHRSTRTSSSYC